MNLHFKSTSFILITNLIIILSLSSLCSSLLINPKDIPDKPFENSLTKRSAKPKIKQINIYSAISGDQVVGNVIEVIAKLDKKINQTLEVELVCKGEKCERILNETRFGVQKFVPDLNSSHNETLKWNLKLIGNGQASLILEVLNENEIDENLYQINNAHSLKQLQVGKSYALQTWSMIVGYIYFVAWMLSLYPILFTNFNLRSVSGLNLDFVALNTTGYLAYAVYNVCLFCFDEFQEVYFAKYPGSQIPVQFNDVLFATHGLVINVLICIQCLFYDRGGHTISRTARYLLVAVYSPAIILTCFYVIDGINKYYYISFFSYAKLLLTLCKYVPQAYFNYKRKSTVGWSVIYCFLDITGGSFSIFQMVLNSINQDDYRNFTGNAGKLGLGAVSISFDILFILQHYVFYRHKEDKILHNDLPNTDYGSSKQFPLGPSFKNDITIDNLNNNNIKFNQRDSSNGIKNEGFHYDDESN